MKANVGNTDKLFRIVLAILLGTLFFQMQLVVS